MAHATRLRLPDAAPSSSATAGLSCRPPRVIASRAAPGLLLTHRPVVAAATNDDSSSSSSSSNATTSRTAKKEEVPIWVRREAERKLQEQAKPDLPWAIYLLASTLTAIAAVGCIFEYVDRNPFFGVLSPDSPAWAPILLTLAVSGFPTAGFLFYKGVTGFNEAAERQDRLDGYLDDEKR